MTGEKMARIRRCHTCSSRYTRHATVDRWPRCKDAGDAYLDDAFLEGPASNCKRDLWRDLEPVDIEAEQAENLAKVNARLIAYGKRLVDVWAADSRDREKLRAMLTQMVTTGELTPEAAAEVENYAVARATATRA